MTSSCPMSTPRDVRELLLWKVKPVSGIVFSAGLAIYFALFALNYSLLLFLCRLAQLFILACLGNKFLGKQCMPTETCIRSTIEHCQARLTVSIENMIRCLVPILEAENFTFMAKCFGVVTVVGMVASYFTTCSLLLLLFVGAFTGPVTYIEHKDRIDPLIKQVMARAQDTCGPLLAKIPKTKSN